MQAYNRMGNDEGNCGQVSSRIRNAYYYPCDAGEELCGKANCIGGTDKTSELSNADVKTHDQCKYIKYLGRHTESNQDTEFNSDQIPVGTPCGESRVCNLKGTVRRVCTPLSE